MSCPICNSETTHYDKSGDTIELTCKRCGSFRISGTASSIINGTLSNIQIANISHWIVTKDEPTSTGSTLDPHADRMDSSTSPIIKRLKYNNE